MIRYHVDGHAVAFIQFPVLRQHILVANGTKKELRFDN
jgi:hypothetical protein